MTVRIHVDATVGTAYALREGESFVFSREGSSGGVVFRLSRAGEIVGAILLGAIGAPRAVWDALEDRLELPEDVRDALDEWFDLPPGQRVEKFAS